MSEFKRARSNGARGTSPARAHAIAQAQQEHPADSQGFQRVRYSHNDANNPEGNPPLWSIVEIDMFFQA